VRRARFLLAIQARTLDWERVKQSAFLTAKTTAMVCWLFVGSALFSAVFAILGGQQLVEHWVLSLNLSPIQFMLLSQAIIFILGWPLEWTEIIVIFVPIFPAAAQALPDRPDPLGHTGVRQPSGSVPVATGGNVGVLSEGRVAAARHAQPDLRRHDAVHADCHRLHGDHVFVAGDDAVAAKLPVRRRLGGCRPRLSAHSALRASGPPE
jgi:hypothetical protein